MTIGGDDAAALRRRLDEAESFGRMTMGVAHDLRNVIAAIGAQTALLLDELPAESPLRRRGEAIRRATGWGERLTRELLAAGGPQPLTSPVADLNRVVSAVVLMLAPVVGDDVDVRTDLDPRVGAVALGAADLEHVAINLILNARDAMPRGGRVTIRTAVAAYANGVGPEPPALLQVEDTGAGMDEATRARAFEPYFTTKAAGKSAGLGLTMVYDVVTRHGGHVEIASEPGHGATLTVILPRVGGAPGTGPAVLVAVEEAGVRDLILEILELHDVPAVPAFDQSDAARPAAHAGPPALVIADAGQGAGAARRVEILRRARPEVRVLYLADRAEDAAGTGEPTLLKPFSVDALVGKVRELLGQLTG